MEINDENQKVSLQHIYFELFILSCNKSYRFNCTVIPLLFHKIPSTTETFVVLYLLPVAISLRLVSLATVSQPCPPRDGL